MKNIIDIIQNHIENGLELYINNKKVCAIVWFNELLDHPVIAGKGYFREITLTELISCLPENIKKEVISKILGSNE